MEKKNEKIEKLRDRNFFIFGWEKKKEKIENIVCINSLSYPLINK